MSLTSFGKCSICTLSFELDNISSLKCGHTYHLDCISKWTDTAKNCPKCRMKNTTRDITRLFVDEPDKSNSFFAMNNNNNDAEISRLRDQLKEAEDSKKAMEQKFTTCKIAKERLEAQVEREKKSAGDQIKSKDRLIKNLERMLQDQEELKHQLELAQRRLKASDFYGLISSKNGADEEKIGKAIDKYSAPNGNPDINVFFKSVQKQFRTIQKTNTLLNAELKKEKQEKNKLAAQLEEANKELESRKRRIQTTNGTSPESPIGRKPLRQTYGTPIPNGYFEKPRVRPSFGFEGGFSFDADSDELFNNKENEDSDIQVISDGPTPMPKKMVMNKSILIDEPTTSNAIEPFSFGDFPTTSNAAAKPTKKKQPYLGDELIEIFSPSFMEQANGGHNKK